MIFICLCVFFRYVIVECEDQDTQQRDPKTHEMYLNVMRRFSQALLKVRNPQRDNDSETSQQRRRFRFCSKLNYYTY